MILHAMSDREIVQRVLDELRGVRAPTCDGMGGYEIVAEDHKKGCKCVCTIEVMTEHCDSCELDLDDDVVAMLDELLHRIDTGAPR